MKKKKKMSKKKKIILIVAIVILLILLIVFASIRQNNVDTDKEIDSLEDMIESLDCKYISRRESEDENYYLDIYLEFKCSTYENGNSQKAFYDLAIEAIAKYLSYQDFRLIDESRELTIAVTCQDGIVYDVLINNLEESDYFNKLMSENNLAQKSNLKEIEVTPSQELNVLINNSWNLDNISFGNKTSTFQGYDIYFDNGYRVREIRHNLFNIVFTKKYTNSVVDDIKVGESFESIKEKLGGGYIEQNSILEYMTKDMYICFTNNEISIYPRIQYPKEEFTKFEDLLEEYNTNKDFVTFMNELTDIWPDYSTYNYNSTYSDIWYPLKGIRIYNDSQSMNGIQIYQEYAGDLKNSNKDLYQVYYKTNQSLIIEQELNRTMIKSEDINITNGEYASNKYVMRSDISGIGQFTNITFYSKDGNNADSELSKDIYANQTYWYDDDNLIYSIQKQGIYVYNATTRQTKTIVTGNDNFEITDFNNDTKILTYDGKNLQITL